MKTAEDGAAARESGRSGQIVAGGVGRPALSIAELAGFDAIDRSAWDALVASAPDGTVFQTFDWLAAWWDAFGEQRRPLILTALRGTELVGAAPLFIDHRCVPPRIRFIGENHADYLTFPSCNAGSAVVEQLLDHLLRRYGAQHDVQLSDVPDSSILGALLRRRTGLSGFLCTGTTPCPRLKMTGDEGQLEKVLDKKSVRRHRAKLAVQGALEVRHLSDRQAILAQLDGFFDQHRRRWAVTPFPSLFEVQADRRFYRNLVNSRLCDGSLVFTTLTLGERILAYHFGLLSRTDLIWYKPSFEITLGRFSPGEVMLGELLLLARERGCEYFDFTRGDEAFKARFSSEVRYNGTYVIYARVADAILARARSVVHGGLRRALNQGTSAGRLLRRVKRTYAAARAGGAAQSRALLASLRLAGGTWCRWLFSQRTVDLYSFVWTAPTERGTANRVQEVRIERLLDEVDYFTAALGSNGQSLTEAYRRLVRGERCFTLVERDCVVACGWVSARSPHVIAEADAALSFQERLFVLYGCRQAEGIQDAGIYQELLVGMRSALAPATVLTYIEGTDAAWSNAIRLGGFALEANIVSRTLSGRRRLTYRVLRPQTSAWEIAPLRT